ncbi:putative oxidoreductase-like protein [Rosellinia necatrix]|uniref:Putative oxidoreductase-like protein n=1 Tax=Rosellinia necatrix TaxID=77044 RepID=A0A1W2TUG1_ROSNE|nr:putative oxidoreductase-like protein [Rosellinia necatrix]
MRPNMRPLMRVTRLQSLPSRTSQAQRAFFASRGSGSLPGGTPGESWAQAMPIGPYYEAILDKPAAKKPEEPAPKTPPPTTTTTTTTTTASTKPPARSSTKKPPKPKADAESTTGPSSPSSSSSSSSGTTTISSTTTTTPPTSPPQPTTTDPISSSSSSSSPAAAEEEQGETRSITFSSRLAGPTQRADRLQSLRHAAQRQRGSLVAGVRVPPRPAEPDDCCMSGCVDCVWDRYRDEMEEWAEASARAQEALRAAAAAAAAADAGTKTTVGGVPVPSSSSSVDDDGGGSEANWRAGEESAENVRPTRRIAKDLWDDDLYTNIPVGIREFMKHEKKLKKKHEEEGTLGG